MAAAVARVRALDQPVCGLVALRDDDLALATSALEGNLWSGRLVLLSRDGVERARLDTGGARGGAACLARVGAGGAAPLLVAGCDNGDALLVRVESIAALPRFSVEAALLFHDDCVTAVCAAPLAPPLPSPPLLCTASRDGSVALWDALSAAAAPSRPLAVWGGARRAAVVCCCGLPGGVGVAAGDRLGVRLVDFRAPREAGFIFMRSGVTSLASAAVSNEGDFAPAETAEAVRSGPGRLLAVGCEDGSVRLVDMRAPHLAGMAGAGQPAPVIQAGALAVGALLLSGDERTLAAGCDDGSVSVATLSYGNTSRRVGTHADYVRALAWSRDCANVISGGFDRAVRLWSVA